MNFSDLSRVTVRRFCGIPVSEENNTTEMCTNEAAGDMTFESEGEQVVVPVCLDCAHKLTVISDM